MKPYDNHQCQRNNDFVNRALIKQGKIGSTSCLEEE